MIRLSVVLSRKKKKNYPMEDYRWISSAPRTSICVNLRSLHGRLIFLSGLRFEFHKLFGHVVVVPLREYPQDRPSGLVHLYSPAETEPFARADLYTDERKRIKKKFVVFCFSKGEKFASFRMSFRGEDVRGAKLRNSYPSPTPI